MKNGFFTVYNERVSRIVATLKWTTASACSVSKSTILPLPHRPIACRVRRHYDPLLLLQWLD